MLLHFNARTTLLVACLLVILNASPAQAVGTTDKREIIRQARAAYYNLRNHGLVSFQADVQPNWRLVLKDQLTTNPVSAEEAVRLLNGIRTTAAIGKDGAVSVDNREDVAPSNEQQAKGFAQVLSGMQQAASGFLDSWKPFMLTSPFPEVSGNYTVDEIGAEYRLRYNEGTSIVRTAMSKNLLIREIKVTGPQFTSVFNPRFTKSEQGFLLSGYEAVYTDSSGVSLVDVQIDNQPVDGFELPHNLDLRGSYHGTPFVMTLTFSNYRLESR